MLCGMYLLFNTPLIPFAGGLIWTYLVQPVLWLALAYTVARVFPGCRAAGRLRMRRLLNWLALSCAVLHILAILAAGMVAGFGKSPYSHTFSSILTNFFYAGSMLTGLELARAFLINNLTGRRAFFTIFTISLFFTVTSIPIIKLATLRTALEITEFAGSIFFPALFENILACFLAYLGGPLPAIIYRGAIQSFHWFCPFLPDLKWVIKMLLGSFIPLFSLLLVHRIYLLEAREIKNSGEDKENPFWWVLNSAVSIILIWFSLGLFPIYPSVILTGSMEPLIMPGDIVLVKKIDGGSAKKGDVIHFRRENTNIMHRVINVKGADKKIYLTKGDANKVADSSPVDQNQVRGKLIYVVPKMGQAVIFFKKQMQEYHSRA